LPGFEVEDKRLGSMAHPHQPYWLGSGGISCALGAALLGVAGTLDAARTHYSLLTSPFTIAAYGTFFIVLICLACAIREIRFPFAAKDLRSWETEGGERLPGIRRYPRVRPDDADDTGAPADSMGPERYERSFVEDSPKRLIAIYKKYTKAQAQKLLRPYCGRWIRVMGTLGDVGEWTGSNSTVTFQPSFRSAAVFMVFTDKDVFDKSLSILRAGTHITVIGKIERIDSKSMQITDCEIESVGR
jgi:putative nucleic acid binding protein